ncbi:MAG TPA: restriction endonuclease subunit S [Candidatus Competibacter sp.]|nr:restriction endonuclease subunit S [Candidatus Competibacteraceae bacterium]HPE70928.1 restriction endonuclease subunit S [Candidatus Competibacter sp.]HRW65397.1 restriction endonuclease subunit S [Candidatus Competibacter sp.]
MKFESFKNARVVRSSWLEEGGRRLDCNPYMSGALEARDTLKSLDAPKEPLKSLTAGYAGGIYNGPMFARHWVEDPRYGVPFLSNSDMMNADLSMLPLLKKSYAESRYLSYLKLEPGMTLITCSGTIGRMTYVRPDMAGMWSSQHIMKVVPDESRIPPGYLYAFLSSKYGVPLVVSGTYGAIIQHIEPEHIANLPVPRFGDEFEGQIHTKIDKAARLLTTYQTEGKQATVDLFESVGLSDITADEWHSWGPDVGFAVSHISTPSLRALNFNPRFKKLAERISQGPHKKLKEICLPGTLSRGERFKRIDAAPGHAYQMIGQKELFCLRPEGRWIAKTALDPDSLGVLGAALVAAQGTLGESELYCRAEFVWGSWTKMAFSEHILRVIADSEVMPRGCLFAFMRSETAFRMLRSISSGTKLQDHHYAFRGELPVPYPDKAIQKAIHEKVVSAYEARHRAVALLDEATRMVEIAIGGGED